MWNIPVETPAQSSHNANYCNAIALIISCTEFRHCYFTTNGVNLPVL